MRSHLWHRERSLMLTKLQLIDSLVPDTRHIRLLLLRLALESCSFGKSRRRSVTFAVNSDDSHHLLLSKGPANFDWEGLTSFFLLGLHTPSHWRDCRTSPTAQFQRDDEAKVGIRDKVALDFTLPLFTRNINTNTHIAHFAVRVFTITTKQHPLTQLVHSLIMAAYDTQMFLLGLECTDYRRMLLALRPPRLLRSQADQKYTE